QDNVDRIIPVSLTESLSLADVVVATKLVSVSLTESIPFVDTIDITSTITVSLSESLQFVDALKTIHDITLSLTELLILSDSATSLVNIGPNQVLVEKQQSSVTVTKSNTELVVVNSTTKLKTIFIESNISDTIINYTSIKTGNKVTIENGWDTSAKLDGSIASYNVKMTVANSTTITGPAGWEGDLKLPTLTSITIPDTETQTFSDTTAFNIGLSSAELTFDKPIRLLLSGDGGNKGFVAFYQKSISGSPLTFINTVCNADDFTTVNAQLGGTGECKFDNGSDLIIWTTHATTFGDSRGASKGTPSSGGDSSSTSGSSGGGGSSGGSTVSTSGFGGILGSPLAINEISYDKCTDNMARILVSSNADVPPTVKVTTAKSGVIFATLAEVQPYEDLNKFSTVDRYVYEIPIASDESFIMVTVTEEIGTKSNIVRASVKLLSCEGTTVVVPLPEDALPEISEGTVKIFDTKVQIGNATAIDAEESEFIFVSGQDLRVSAIIDSATQLERVELRSITMGQTDADYIGIKMDVTPLYVSNSTYVITATIPSFWIVEPGMIYWLHITDENGAQTESVRYNIGAKPISIPDIAIEVDMPTIRPSGSIVNPEFYLFNDDKPSYGIVSLVVDGEIVSKRSQLFGTGQTQIIFNWNVPNSDVYIDYNIQGVVELYDSKITTASSVLATHPKTITVAASEIPSLEVIQRDGKILADPALVYASNADPNVRFTVIDPQGQCIIGIGNECIVNDSTRGNRGGLESIPYGDQILRVRYSGADNALERFSITSIDPIVGQWAVSLESEDGIVQQAHASEDINVKIKYRYHSETITLFS
ncbi:hypothetical protein, partial [Nitrosopumilus sp.]